MVEVPKPTWNKLRMDLRDAQRHAYDGETGAAHEYLRVVNDRLDEIEEKDKEDD